ncbi:MAG: hypothetical protein OEZ47_17685 [Gammaproteobacteria bacterium]|nr:hypothetical protein [Gammaproteobacteria bacterium]
MDSIIENIKTIKAAYIVTTLGASFPLITYPITSLSANALLMQVAFLKNGVFYEPTVTDYTLSLFGLVGVPFGIVLSVCITVFICGLLRIVYLKKTHNK